jgi:hypothetical protein
MPQMNFSKHSTKFEEYFIKRERIRTVTTNPKQPKLYLLAIHQK